jgi:hypothetical protein
MKTIALIVVALSAGCFGASAWGDEINHNRYIHCGDYNGLEPDVSLTRYGPDEAGIFNKPMWSFTYAVKQAHEGRRPIRHEVSCRVSTVSRDGAKWTFAGEGCPVTIFQEMDGGYSVQYESMPKISGCAFDPEFDEKMSGLLADFAADEDKL